MIHKITISPVLNGFLCQVGCQTLAFQDLNLMLGELRQYLTDPAEAEQRYRQHAQNRYLLAEQPCPPPPPAAMRQLEPRAQQERRTAQECEQSTGTPPDRPSRNFV